MGIGPRDQERWDFTLLLGRPFGSPEAIDWPALLPPPDVTKWLTMDPSRKHLTIEPSAAVPDASTARHRRGDGRGGPAAHEETLPRSRR
jgi:hypothetical protein